MRVPLTLSVNGASRSHDVEPRRTLADFLRDDCGLTGTHLGCEEGACGACTVLLDGVAVRSCTLFAIQCEGAEVRTIEGLGGAGGTHPVQDAFLEHHGFQCGFCTPGFIMLAAGMLEATPDIGRERLEETLSSNICRCTGYRNIVAAVVAAQRSLLEDQG